MKLSLALLSLAILTCSTQAAAQEYELTRRHYTFFDNSLTIEVVSEIPGRLQVVRGEKGRVEVAARVPGGIPAFAMGGREYDRLRLTALGGEEADFVVVVPEDASVRVKLPNARSHAMTSMRPAGTFSWGGTATSKASAPAALPVPTRPTTAYSKDHAPRTLNIPKLNSVRTISVRFEGSTFLVAGTQWMRVSGGNPNNIEVQTGDQLQDVIITLPIGTNGFAMRLGGRLAMQVSNGEIRTYCEPLTEQDLGAGRKWYTFTPDMGRMTCR